MKNYLSDSLATYRLIMSNQYQSYYFKEAWELRRSLDLRGDVRWVLYTNNPIGKRSITDRVFMDRFLTEGERRTP